LTDLFNYLYAANLNTA